MESLKKFEMENKKIIEEVNEKITKDLSLKNRDIYEALNEIHECFEMIKNKPIKRTPELNELKEIKNNWINNVKEIEKKFNYDNKKYSNLGTTGTLIGVGTATLAPTAAMGVATTFGVASTGTAISSLSGAAATNAALAWLGGGALTAGGGGMVAGQTLLGLAGPVGWMISAVSILAAGFSIFNSKQKERNLKNIFERIYLRDNKKFSLAKIELNERIIRIYDETLKLRDAIGNIKTFGTDYSLMTDEQKYTLGVYINLMNASTQLLVNPILGLQPYYTEEDYKKYDSFADKNKNKDFIIGLANLLYKIDLTKAEAQNLVDYIKSNDKMFKTATDKSIINVELIEFIEKIVDYKLKKS